MRLHFAGLTFIIFPRETPVCLFASARVSINIPRWKALYWSVHFFFFSNIYDQLLNFIYLRA